MQRRRTLVERETGFECVLMFNEKIIFLLWKNNVMKFSYAKPKNFNCNMSTPSHRASLFHCDKWNIRFNGWSGVLIVNHLIISLRGI